MNQPNETSSEFERELVKAIAPVDAPEGFATRVLEQADAPKKSPPSLFVPLRIRIWSSGAIAAVLLLGVLAAEQMHKRHQQEQAEKQFDAAIRITDNTLDHVRRQLQNAGIQIGD